MPRALLDRGSRWADHRMSGVRFVRAFSWGLAFCGLAGCASPSTQPVPLAPPVTASLPAPLPAPPPSPALTQRDAIAVVRTHTKPTIWIALHTELKDHAAGRALVSGFSSKSFEEAKIDPGDEIDALVAGCDLGIGCFTLFEHHIAPERLRRFLEIMAEKSISPAEWVSREPPAVRVTFADGGKRAAVLTQVNENLLLASLRPAPDLVQALQKTRGLEPSQDGVVAVGGMVMPRMGLDDGLSLEMKMASDGGLAGELHGKMNGDLPATLVAKHATERLQGRFDVWWLPAGVFPHDFQFETSESELEMAVRLEPSLMTAIASGLRFVTRFR